MKDQAEFKLALRLKVGKVERKLEDDMGINNKTE